VRLASAFFSCSFLTFASIYNTKSVYTIVYNYYYYYFYYYYFYYNNYYCD